MQLKTSVVNFRGKSHPPEFS